MNITIPETWCGIYHLKLRGVVVYVGQTMNVFGRIGSHQVRRTEFDSVEFFPCAASDLDAIELEHLARLKPSRNAEGVTKPFRPCRRPPNAKGQWLNQRDATAA